MRTAGSGAGRARAAASARCRACAAGALAAVLCVATLGLGLTRADAASPFAAAYKSKLYFGAFGGFAGCELWATDGTKKGTKLFKNVATGPVDSRPFWFERFQGRRVWVRSFAPIDGSRTWEGRLLGLQDGQVVVETARGTVRVPLDQVARARLVAEF